MDKLNIVRQQLIEAKFENGMGVPAADFHDPQRLFRRVFQQGGPRFLR